MTQNRFPRTGMVALALVMVGLHLAFLDQVPAQDPSALPSESQLPGAIDDPALLPGEDELPGNEGGHSASLPGEDELPGQPSSLPDQGGVDGEMANLFGPSPPILRLAFDGHTGLVRTLDLSDGGRTLITAGEDKDVHVWRRTDLDGTGWLHRRTIRWPVTRGPRGRIYAARLKGDQVAFAGHGAFGFNGEIRIADAASGELLQVLADEQSGHRQVVTSLTWSPETTSRLASIDIEGRLILWAADATTGLWRPTTWVKPDSQTYGPEIATSLSQDERRTFVPLTFAGPHHVVVPRYVGLTEKTEPRGFVNWHLHRIDLREPKNSVLLTNMDHVTHVRSLSATDDGRVLASCDRGDDSGGTVGIWNFAADGSFVSARTFKPETPPIFVDLDSTGARVLVGTERTDGAPARLQLWDIDEDQPKLLSEKTTPDDVLAGVLDDEHREAIVTQGNNVAIYPYDPDGQLRAPKQLTVPAKPIRKVAFSKDEGSYKIAIGWNSDAEGKTLLEAIFDLTESKLLGRDPIDATAFIELQRTAERWQIRFSDDSSYQLYEGDQPRGTLPLVFDRHGGPTTICTLPIPDTGAQEPGERATTGAVIVGTSGRSNIYAYRADASEPPELLRQFRDHSGQVTSLSTSADGNYLVSGSDDATISVWNLQDLFTASKSVNRWGTDFEIEGDQLIATNVRQDGPLYFRGVRGGDRLLLLEWTDHDGKGFAESDPEKIQQQLLELPFDLMTTFKFARLGRPGPHFQSYPAWRPLATLFIDQEREWAFWSPAGYYDASFNGHQRFGWQINGRNVDRPVAYYRAAQFRKALERPDIMRGLLAAGSLSAAMQQTVSQIGPSPAQSAIVNQIESKPTIRLLSPALGETIEGDTLTVEAEIEVPQGATLVEPRAFVSGVPAVSMQPITTVGSEGANTKAYRWTFRLPSDPVLQLEVLAATESESIDRVLVNLEHQTDRKRVAKPRLHVIALGVSQYQDPQIQSLDFAAKAADDVTKLFEEHSAEIYQTTTSRLVDEDATRPLWRVFARTAADELAKTVSPDDLVIMYLCGHGLRDRSTNEWYFVTADARFRDLMSDQYADCIAFSDLAALSQLPCRKLAILDSCHSGAVQPLMRREDLKSALRFLQDDLVLTLTASEGDEEAAEQREKRLGRFTAALSDALRGAASDLDSDPRTVSLNELIRYVSQRVADESAQADVAQHPTASPAYLLRTLEIPLTSRAE